MWKTCRDFAKAGAEEYGRTALEVVYRIFIMPVTWAKTLFVLRIRQLKLLFRQ